MTIFAVFAICTGGGPVGGRIFGVGCHAIVILRSLPRSLRSLSSLPLPPPRSPVLERGLDFDSAATSACPCVRCCCCCRWLHSRRPFHLLSPFASSVWSLCQVVSDEFHLVMLRCADCEPDGVGRTVCRTLDSSRACVRMQVCI